MTKEKFHAFVKVQYGGQVNMLDCTRVIQLSGYKLTAADHLEIIKNYDEWFEQFGDLDSTSD